MACFTVVSFSASSSLISSLNSSSRAMTSSTTSRESAPRSSTKCASGLTSFSSTPSCSTMMFLTLSSMEAIVTFLRPKKESRPGLLRAVGRGAFLHVHPAVDVQRDTGHIGSGVAHEVGHPGGDVVGSAQALQGDLGEQRLALRFGERLRHVGIDEAGG